MAAVKRAADVVDDRMKIVPCTTSSTYTPTNTVLDALCRGYTHRFPRPRCCPTSPSLPRFKNVVRGNRTECACSFLSDFVSRGFSSVSQKTPIRTSDGKIGRVVNVFDFLVREAWTTPWTKKSVRVAAASDAR